jgi:hypothetical protein
MKYIILFLFLTTVKSSDDVNITSYLEQFGYLESNGSLLTETSLTSASHTITYFTLFYPTGFKGFLYFTVLNKLTIPKSFFFLF